MSRQRICSVLLVFLSLFWGCGTTQELPPAYLLTANMHDKCLKVLREGLHSNEFWPSVHAAEALIDAGYGFDATPVLKARLSEEEDALYRIGLAQALVRSGERHYLTILQDVLLTDQESAREEALRGMFYLADVADVPLVQTAYNRTDQPSARLWAAGVLSRVIDAKTVDVIREGLVHEDPGVRLTAAELIPVMGSVKTDTTQLLANLGQANTDIERLYILRALALLSHTLSRQQMGSMLFNEDPTIRSKAVYAAAEAWLLDRNDQIFSLLDDPSLAVRVRAAQASLILTDPVSPYRYLRTRD